MNLIIYIGSGSIKQWKVGILLTINNSTQYTIFGYKFQKITLPSKQT